MRAIWPWSGARARSSSSQKADLALSNLSTVRDQCPSLYRNIRDSLRVVAGVNTKLTNRRNREQPDQELHPVRAPDQ